MASMPHLSAPTPVVGHDSALFDPRVVMGQDGAVSSCNGGTAGITSTTSNGREVHFSVRLAAPPATSYVHARTADRLLEDPSVLAACGDLLLIQMVVLDAGAGDEGAISSSSYPENWFVYRVDHVAPWIQRLPHLGCFTGWAQATGIASRGHGQEDFVVAGFRTCETWEDDDPAKRHELGQILRYSPTTRQWLSSTLTLPYDGVALKPFLWVTDKVFSSSSSQGSIYWVDYHRGLLFCDDVFDDDDKNCNLRFVPFPPQIEIWTDPTYFFHGRMYPEAYRTVGDCNGIVKFVDVDNGLFGSTKKSGFTVTVWTLKTPQLEWDKLTVLRVDDLWSLPNFRDSPLPRWVPQFPMVSREDADLLYFILQDYGHVADDWVLTVNMSKIALQSYVRRADASGFSREGLM